MKQADQNAKKASIKMLEIKIQYLKDEIEPLKSRELATYEKKRAAYYKHYKEPLPKGKEKQGLQAEKAHLEDSRAEHLRFCERIRRDIERIFMLKPTAPTNEVFWHILPPGEWTVDSVLSHYSTLQRTNPNVKFDVDRLRQVFSLGPSTLYVGIDEFEGYIVFAFPKTKKVVLECPVYGNAIYIIPENWESLSRLSKGELLSGFPGQVLRIVHAGDWYPRLRAKLFSGVR
jgi:hypothetical protein